MTDLLKTKNRTSQFYELHGMTLEQWRILYHIFDRFRDTLSWVKLFGSRARGDYKTTSDVDLEIASKADILTPLQAALEDSQLPYTFDLEDGIERSQTGSSGPIRWQTSAGWLTCFCKEPGRFGQSVPHFSWPGDHLQYDTFLRLSVLYPRSG